MHEVIFEDFVYGEILFIYLFEISLHVKYKLFLSAMEYLPFSSGNESKASFEDIIERLVYIEDPLINHMEKVHAKCLWTCSKCLTSVVFHK